MPTLKTEILGAQIEINYEEEEYNKLQKLIENFKTRLKEFPNNGKNSTNTIFFLAALKAEDELKEIKINLKKNNELIESDKKIILDNLDDKKKLNQEIFSLKNDLNKLNEILSVNKKDEKIIFEEIVKLEEKFKNIQDKMESINL
jgi:cell division protein ZapA (FtsZ GTPase activity inhibitor)